ncbi:hypothetical protein GGR54DRAFT_96856 [Hypoxylon sp. NC1633]|nr:hypothetical protein GGR54DRAFT_96856 [Hypoxylon sp. NC1633]
MINLGSAGDLTLRNVALLDTAYNDLSMMGSLEFYGGSPFLNSSYIGIPFLTAVGSDANIGSNSNGHLSFGSLANVPGSLFVTNNTNCTMDFDRLTNVGNLSIVDNDSSTVPILSALETANNIHLRGYIDSSAGFNIFPALQLAKGTVTIEASKGFNCSKLVFQQRGGIIHNLICNGTDNGTTITRPVQPGPTIVSNTTDTAATSPSTLTAGAWAGIGVGIGIVVLGGVAGAIWFILHVKRKYKDLIKRLNSPTQNPDSANDVPPPNLEGLHETEGQGIRREASDSQVYEMHVQPTEKPDDHIRELPSLPPELAGDPLWSVGLAETTDLPQIQSQQRARSPYI